VNAVLVGRGGKRHPVAELAPFFPSLMRRVDEIAAEQADADAYEPIVEGVS
jgi:hypothetical protein